MYIYRRWKIIRQNKKLAVVFYGSPHYDSYTKLALDYFISKLNGYEFSMVDSYKESVHPCIDCGYCKDHEGCKFSDMDEIDTYLRAADLLVFASPIYNFSVPSPLKAILDRMQRYYCARFNLNLVPPIKKRKKAFIVLTCGSNEIVGKEIIEKQLAKIFTVINVDLSASILYSGTDHLKIFGLTHRFKERVNNVIDALKFDENS